MKRLTSVLIILSLVIGLHSLGLTGVKPSATYKSLLTLRDHGLTTHTLGLGDGSNILVLTDGAGIESPISLSKTVLQMNTTNKLYFRNDKSYIYSNTADELTAYSLTKVTLESAALTFTGNTTTSGTSTIAGLLTTGNFITTGGGLSAINNVPIGGVTPAAGGFTTLDATGTLGVTGTSTITALVQTGAVDMNATTFDVDATDDIDIDTSDTTGGLALATLTSGVPITIGHAISETTVGDNLTVMGTFSDGTASLAAGSFSALTRLDVDNLRLDGNTITTTDINGSLTITPSGTGTVIFSSVVDMANNAINFDSNGDTRIVSDIDDRLLIYCGNVPIVNIDGTDFSPGSGDAIDLGTTVLEWKDLFIDGTATIDDIVCDNDITVAATTRLNGATTTNGTVTINEAGDAADDVRMESDTNANMFFLDSSADVIGINESSPNTNLELDIGGDVALSGILALDGTAQTLTGAGNINTTTSITKYRSTGIDEELTISNGAFDGQIKYIIHTNDSGNGNLTGANITGTLNLTDDGGGATLIWSVDETMWYVVGVAGATYNP